MSEPEDRDEGESARARGPRTEVPVEGTDGSGPSARAEGHEKEKPVAASGDDSSTAEESAAANSAAPSGKKKKNKKAKKEEAPIDDPRAREIETAFTVGDYARVREIASELVKSEDARIADLGREYLHRTSVDPVQIAFLGFCAMVLIAIAWIYIPH